jgi:hypothetical protein
MILFRMCQSKEEKAEHRKLSHECELHQAQIQILKNSKQAWEVRESEYQHDFVQNLPVERREGRTQQTFTPMRTESSTNTGIGNIKTNLRSQGIRISAWLCSECASAKKRRRQNKRRVDSTNSSERQKSRGEMSAATYPASKQSNRERRCLVRIVN